MHRKSKESLGGFARMEKLIKLASMRFCKADGDGDGDGYGYG